MTFSERQSTARKKGKKTILFTQLPTEISVLLMVRDHIYNPVHKQDDKDKM